MERSLKTSKVIYLIDVFQTVFNELPKKRKQKFNSEYKTKSFSSFGNFSSIQLEIFIFHNFLLRKKLDNFFVFSFKNFTFFYNRTWFPFLFSHDELQLDAIYCLATFQWKREWMPAEVFGGKVRVKWVKSL